MATVTHLANSQNLTAALPLAQLSLVLFTATWSYDSLAAISSLQTVASAFPPSSLPPYIAFYTLPIPITQVHATQPTQNLWFPTTTTPVNATAHIPWFPSLRLFAAHKSFTFGDTFTPPAIRAFILAVAHTVLAPSPSLTAATALLPRARSPTELSPDSLTHLFFHPTAAPHRAALLFLPTPPSRAHTALWRSLLTATTSANLNSSHPRPWAASIISTARYALFAANFNLSHTGLVLLDAVSDDLLVTPLPRDVPRLLRAFPPPRAPGAAVRAAVEAAVADGGDVWVIVHEVSCGLSQRARAVLRELQARTSAVVVEVGAGQALPTEIDRLVDGYPTLLRPVCWVGGCVFEEYHGGLEVGEMMAAA